MIGFIGGLLLFLLFVATFNNNWPGKVEGYFFPVSTITEFKVERADDTYEQRDANYTILRGELVKTRACEFLGIEARIIDRRDHASTITVEVLEPDKIRHIGKHTWGPWLIQVPYSNIVNHNLRIELITHHRCHPFWHTVSTIR